MNARLWKRSAVAGSTLILALAPFGVTSMAAVAATPNQTHTAVGSDNDFRKGFRAGFRGGYADARDDCQASGGGVSQYNQSTGGDNDYARGYASGYSSGFARAENRYC
ncbi:hypothetical protein [Streptomyces sp. NBC_01361]|uniref:hypothetical protein n=1 Tax=Streptomyces sp. NBC_01361 TaxID=2903838 RepID=UPI002E31364C|nr:hypothetical protein [Streptomyces sp. NBC_01361]